MGGWVSSRRGHWRASSRSGEQWGEGGLGTGSGVDLARSSSGQTVRGDPFLARVHSTKAAKSSRGPTSDNSALHAVFRLESLNAQRALSW